jgi:NADPH:quinone reductase-like Zn-dependent oxidoreductase
MREVVVSGFATWQAHDAGKIRTTVAEHFGTINAANLKRAHALLETGKARGKIVVEGF